MGKEMRHGSGAGIQRRCRGANGIHARIRGYRAARSTPGYMPKPLPRLFF